MPHCIKCLAKYKESKVLHCGHTFCLACLEQCRLDNEVGDSCLKCPQCTAFYIPFGGLEELPNNYAIRPLTPVTSSVYGYNPQNNEQDPLGSEFLPGLESVPGPQPLPGPEPLLMFCRYHPSNEIEFYCYDCKTIACIICFKERHHKHRLAGIEEAFAEFGEQLRKDMNIIMPYIETSRDELKVIEEHKKVLVRNVKRAKEEVSDRCGQLMSILQLSHNELLNELDLFQAKMSRELEKRKEEVEAQISSVDSFKSSYEEMMAENDPLSQIVLADKVQCLHMIATDLSKTQDKLMVTQLALPHVQFIEGTEMSNWIGHFDYQGIVHETQSRNSTNQMNSTTQPPNQSQNSNINTRNSTIQPFYERINSPNQLNSATQPSDLIYSSIFLQQSPIVRIIYDSDNIGTITGIAAFKKKVFVVRDETTDVLVYDAPDFIGTPVQLKISHNKMKYPRIAACPFYHYLFVSTFCNTPSSIIFRINILNNSVKQWHVGGDCSGLSVTNDNNLLVTMTRGSIYEYTADGILLRELILDRSLHILQHCIQLSDGNFAVSHSSPREKQISIVDARGEVLHSLCRCPRPSHSMASRTEQLAVDKYDHLFVVDSNCDKIQVLNSMLGHICYIHNSWDKIMQASSMELDEINSLLYVGEVSGRLLVFSA